MLNMSADMRELISRLTATKLATPATLKGCTDAQIALIEEAQGVVLPAFYKEFLKSMGLEAGQLLQGSDFLFSNLLRLKESAIALLEECSPKLKLPDGVFVFYMHQGYQFDFFYSKADSAHCPIYHYMEGEHEFRVTHNSFYELLHACIAAQYAIRKEMFDRNGTWPE